MIQTTEPITLDTARITGIVIPCVEYARARFQFIPTEGTPSTGVVNVRPAYDAAGIHVDASTSVAELDTTGGAVSANVESYPFLVLEVSTAQAGLGGYVVAVLEDEIQGEYRVIRFDAASVGRVAEIPTHGFEVAHLFPAPVSAATAVVEVREAIVPDHPAAFSPALTLGLSSPAVTRAEIVAGVELYLWCTTAQADLEAEVFVYTRGRTIEERAAGSDWDGAICLDFEESGNVSTGTSSGFQYSVGNGDVGDFGTVVPFDFDIIGVGACFLSHPAGTTATIEVYKGSGLSASSGTGVSVTVPDAAGAAHTDATASPVSGNAGEWLVPKTTATTGGSNIGGARISVWIKPR